jgi:hypothetical protein
MPHMLVLEPILIFYLCGDAVHVGIGVDVDVSTYGVTPYLLVVVFGGKEAGKSDLTRPSSWTPAD